MLRVVRALSVLPVLLLGACASAPTWEVDQQKIAAIDRAAARQGVKVMWVTLPTRRVAATPG